METTKEKKIFFVDDEPAVRKAVAQTLAQLDNCSVSCFGDAESCFRAVSRKECDLVITDISMPGTDGLKLLEQIKQIRPKLPVILVTGYGDVSTAVKGLKGGAIDFIEKPLNEETFLPVIKEALETTDYKLEPDLAKLTKAEINVLRRVINGKSNKQVAADLQRSVRTVENHRHRLMKKLGATNAAALVRKAIKMGFAPDLEI
jgi:two-component system response regulator FixJ